MLSFVASWPVDVEVLVLSTPADSIPPDVRCRWLSELGPAARVRSLDIGERAASPDSTLRAALAGTSLLVGAGLRDVDLARRLGLEYVPVEVPWPIPEGADVPAAPLAHWPALPDPDSSHVVRRVVVMGPESTGKTTLARDLARHYGTVWLPEYLRIWLDAKGAVCEPEDLPKVVAGHQASEAALARHANRVLFCDTDPLMTAVYSGFYYGHVPAWLDAAASARRADAYLLLDTDVPWVPDPHRDMPHRRLEIRDRCRAELERRALPWALVSGAWAERFSTACAIVDRLIESSGER